MENTGLQERPDHKKKLHIFYMPDYILCKKVWDLTVFKKEQERKESVGQLQREHG